MGIINDTLDFSKIESGKLELGNINFTIEEVFKSVEQLFSFQNEEKAVQLVFPDTSKLSSSYRGDPLRLRQILTNLVSNAVKFSPSGSKVIVDVNTVEKESSDKGYMTLHFNVKDEGIGIPSDGMNDYLSKPIDIETMLTTIARYL